MTSRLLTPYVPSVLGALGSEALERLARAATTREEPPPVRGGAWWARACYAGAARAFDWHVTGRRCDAGQWACWQIRRGWDEGGYIVEVEIYRAEEGAWRLIEILWPTNCATPRDG